MISQTAEEAAEDIMKAAKKFLPVDSISTQGNAVEQFNQLYKWMVCANKTNLIAGSDLKKID